jgi:hypothetical protein
MTGPKTGGRSPVSPDCVFDASLVPETCRDRFVDLKGFIKQVSGESDYRRCKVKLHLSGFGVNQDLPPRKLVFNKLGYFVSPSERAQVQRPISPLEIIISAMWIASGGFLGSP